MHVFLLGYFEELETMIKISEIVLVRNYSTHIMAN